VKNFSEFWPYYLSQHQSPICRWLHFVGTFQALAVIIFSFESSRYSLIPVSVLLGYALAWIGHFLVERNRPATFKYPVWSLLADIRMFLLMVSNQLGPHLRHLTKN
jgi:hypothetical protein